MVGEISIIFWIAAIAVFMVACAVKNNRVPVSYLGALVALGGLVNVMTEYNNSNLSMESAVILILIMAVIMVYELTFVLREFLPKGKVRL